MSSRPPPTTSSASYGIATSSSDATPKTSTVSKNELGSAHRSSLERDDEPDSPASSSGGSFRRKAKKMANKAKNLFTPSRTPTKGLSISVPMPTATQSDPYQQDAEEVKKKMQMQMDMQRQAEIGRAFSQDQTKAGQNVFSQSTLPLNSPAQYRRPAHATPNRIPAPNRLAQIMEEEDAVDEQDEDENEESINEGAAQHLRSLQLTTTSATTTSFATTPTPTPSSPPVRRTSFRHPLQMNPPGNRPQTAAATPPPPPRRLPPPPPTSARNRPRPLPRPPSPTGE